MEVRLSPDQEFFVRQAIETGRLRRPEDAVKEALSLWEEKERTRAELRRQPYGFHRSVLPDAVQQPKAGVSP